MGAADSVGLGAVTVLVHWLQRARADGTGRFRFPMPKPGLGIQGANLPYPGPPAKPNHHRAYHEDLLPLELSAIKLAQGFRRTTTPPKHNVMAAPFSVPAPNAAPAISREWA